jgi:hypothetical protein
MKEIVITPRAGYVGVRICEPERHEGLEYFAIELFSPEARARTRVYAYEPSSIAAFFEDLARNWRGWKDEKSWESLEGECRISAVSDGKGHVDLKISLRPSLDPHAWRFDGIVLIEAGQLESVAARVRVFVDGA